MGGSSSAARSMPREVIAMVPGASHRTWQVGDAIVHDFFFNVCRFTVGCRPACFYATALVDRHVDDHTPQHH